MVQLVLTEYSFDDVCLPLYDELLNHARKLCGESGDGGHAEDVVQDSIEKAMRAWDHWEPEGDIKRAARGWLFRIVTNTFTKHYHRKRVRYTASKDRRTDILIGTYGGVDESTAPEVPDNQFSDEVRVAIENLKPNHREALELHYLEGWDVAKIAEHLNSPEKTVRVRLHRARVQLEKELGAFAAKAYGFVTVSEQVPAVSRAELEHQAESEQAGLEQSTMDPQAEACSIDSIVAGDDGGAFDDVESASYEHAAW